MHSLSIVVLAHNQLAYTQACLNSLRETTGVRLEVVAVDNGSTDGTGGWLAGRSAAFAERGHTLRILRNEANIGCSTARNRGVDCATGDYCAFMDNDVVAVDPRWAVGLIDAIERAGGRALAGPKLVYPVPPHRIQCAGVAISRTGRVQFRGRGRDRAEPEFSRPLRCQALISACMVFPRRLFAEIGGLDEAFNPIEYEDLDLCYRARAHGYQALYEPAVEVHHWESITSEGTEKLPNTYLIIKHGLLFKKRWRHMFETEDGPPDDACRWERLEVPSLHGRRTR
ncbi:MAG: glycosyltransferase family 2 protein [Candidatus Brocadiaceae bacterium]|nr:glycosyltransferase family 2 protein [Candidatus Brocadiaceae bacterium]